MESSFKDKNVMIIIPHQDDELNICGGMFTSDFFDMKKVKIVFSTNGDYLCNYKARIKEVFKLSKKIGLLKSNVIFLGYPDQHINEKDHLFLTHSPNVFKSKKGDSETFGNNYHYMKYGENAKFNHENFVKDLYGLIGEYKPDVIFTIDFDSHPDHRALSLAFEEAIGLLLNKNNRYRPEVFKAFAYPTYYKGIKDFNNKKRQKTKFLTEPHSLSKFQNPFYDWNERESVNIKNNRLLIFNKTYKLFKIYRSQLIIRKIYSILNDDLVFFRRRTDNLLFNSSISVSSGEKKYLNDFMLFDVNSITNGNINKPKLKNSALLFDKDDNKKEIHIKLNKKYDLKQLILYQNIYDESRVLEVKIIFDDNSFINKKIGKNKDVILLDKKSDSIVIKIINYKGKNFGFSEIELFDKVYDLNNKYYEKAEKGKDNIFLVFVNNITLCYDVFIQKVLNKIDRILGRL